MANLAQALKNEIARIAKRETKAMVEPIRKANAELRSTIAAMKRSQAEQSRTIAGLLKVQTKTKRVGEPQDAAELTTRHRISAKGVKSLREKLGLSADKLAGLVGVSGQTIYLWERGKTSPRAKPLSLLVKLRGLGKKDVQALIERSEKSSAGGSKVKQKTPASKSPAKKASTKKTVAPKAPTKKAAPKKRVVGKYAPPKKSVAANVAQKSAARKAAAKSPSPKTSAPRKVSTKKVPAKPAVNSQPAPAPTSAPSVTPPQQP